MYDTLRGKSKNINHQCGICGENHSPQECNIVNVTNFIPDKTVPPKARLTLPDSLEIKRLADGTYDTYAKEIIKKGTQFGPYQAKKLLTLHPSIDFPLKIFTGKDEDLSEYFLDSCNENECSWLIFVSSAKDFEEQNLYCYQDENELYYSTIKDILPGEPLKVWYAPFYATKMKKSILSEKIEELRHASTDINALLKMKKNITQRDSWSCKFCGKVEAKLSVFAQHLLEHYKAQLRRICEICNESFTSRQLLKKHINLVHGSNFSNPQLIKEDFSADLKMKGNGDSKETCLGGPFMLNNVPTDSLCLDNSSLLLTETDFDLSQTQSILENENLILGVDNILNENVKQLDHFNFEIDELEIEQIVCDICLKNFSKLKSLIQHLEQHTGRFFCQECNKIFCRKENLLYHVCQTFYSLKCPLCDKIFFQKKYLTYHIRIYHEKRFTCEICLRFYDSKKSLQTHNCSLLPDNKKEKFICNVCSKMFFRKKYLEAHMKRHKNMDKKEQAFVCAQCDVILGSRKTYLTHLQLHEEKLHKCDYCDKKFHRRDTLKSHVEQIHLDKKQMETCPTCGRQVKSKKLLKLHLETHQKIKKHHCSLCPATFKQRTNLTKHFKKHQNNKIAIKEIKPDNDSSSPFYCPKCNKKMKLKSSLLRHLKKKHPDDEITLKQKRRASRKLKTNTVSDSGNYEEWNKDLLEEDETVLDLKQTIDNMNFNTDEINTCSENSEIIMEIDKLLSNPENIENFLIQSDDNLVESFISYHDSPETCEENVITLHSTADKKESITEVRLENENAYFLDNGTILRVILQNQ